MYTKSIMVNIRFRNRGGTLIIQKNKSNQLTMPIHNQSFMPIDDLFGVTIRGSIPKNHKKYCAVHTLLNMTNKNVCKNIVKAMSRFARYMPLMILVFV